MEDSTDTCQCEGFQMGQSNGVLLIKEVSTFRSCPLIEVLLYDMSKWGTIKGAEWQ